MRILIIIMIAGCCFAEKDSGCTKPLNEKYSFKDLQNKTFVSLPASEFNNTCIKGTNFYQELGIDKAGDRVKIFPKSMRGAQFVRCNLDNVEVSGPNTTDARCSKRRIKVQNDLSDWVLKADGSPSVPVGKERFLEKGISINPRDIPLVRLKKRRGDL